MDARAQTNPAVRFASHEVVYDDGEVPNVDVEVIEDHSRNIISTNDSPDIGFRFSVNPYRGCQHACAYCYARPTHEYLSMGAGTDFDTRIVVKRAAAVLLREAFEKKSWKGDTVVFSGVTDCYQPLEQKLQLTRACLEVCLEYKNPVGIITKSALVERDVELLLRLREVTQVHVSISIPFIDKAKARAVEPWVASPQRRLQAIETLARAGLPVGVMVAPVIPGLSDEDMPAVLEEAARRGATHAGYVLLRLPGSVKDVFETRMRDAFGSKADKILHRVRETRGGELYDPRFGTRQRGQGAYADMIQKLFTTTAKRAGLVDARGHDGTGFGPTTFARPSSPSSPSAEPRKRQLALL